jgi:hypothetical protein
MVAAFYALITKMPPLLLTNIRTGQKGVQETGGFHYSVPDGWLLGEWFVRIPTEVLLYDKVTKVCVAMAHLNPVCWNKCCAELYCWMNAQDLTLVRSRTYID